MKILLFGKNGQVGWELQRSLSLFGELVALGRHEDHNPEGLCGDLANLEGIAQTIKQVRPDVVVNAAAYTAVDRAESELEIADKINAEAPGVIAKQCDQIGAWMIHYSTDYVFNGSGHHAWRETDLPAPLSIYGQTKLAGENAIRAGTERHIILRTSWVYGAHGQNFIKTILRLASERPYLSIIDDQWGAPTGAELLADVTAQIVPQILKDETKSGIYHCAARGETNWHSYASYIVETAMMNGKNLKTATGSIEPISSSNYKAAAHRPLNSRLNCKKIEQYFSIRIPDWKLGVRRVTEELNVQKNCE